MKLKLKLKLKFPFLLLCLLILQSCQFRMATSNHQYKYNSYIGEQPSIDTIQAIALDLANYLSELYPPGHTKLRIITPTQAEDQTEGQAAAQTEGEADKENTIEKFSGEFETALRIKGFEISDVAQILISYTLDTLDDEASWYVHLRLSDGLSIARSYDAFGYSESPRIQMTH